jgi:hypothetical protein
MSVVHAALGGARLQLESIRSVNPKNRENVSTTVYFVLKFNIKLAEVII